MEKITIGIIGHRNIAAEAIPEITKELSNFLDKIEEIGFEPIIVSSLAEGGDRIGAWVAIKRKLELWVPLPFKKERYEEDFPESKEEFNYLLRYASKVFVEEGEIEYEQAARWIARECQIVIALWDGKDRYNPQAPVAGTAYSVRLRTIPGQAYYPSYTYHIDSPRKEYRQRQEPEWIDYEWEKIKERLKKVYTVV